MIIQIGFDLEPGIFSETSAESSPIAGERGTRPEIVAVFRDGVEGKPRIDVGNRFCHPSKNPLAGNRQKKTDCNKGRRQRGSLGMHEMDFGIRVL